MCHTIKKNFLVTLIIQVTLFWKYCPNFQPLSRIWFLNTNLIKKLRGIYHYLNISSSLLSWTKTFNFWIYSSSISGNFVQAFVATKSNFFINRTLTRFSFYIVKNNFSKPTLLCIWIIIREKNCIMICIEEWGVQFCFWYLLAVRWIS